MSRVWSAPPAALDQHRSAWENLVVDPPADVSTDVRRHVGRIGRVVDVGCGAGQELLPYLGDAVCVGLDLTPQSVALARGLLRGRRPEARIALLCARVEALPLRSQSVDVAICRLVLSYTDNRCAVREMARVLRPGGALVLTFHSHRYYARKLAAALRTRDLRPAVYSLRVLLTGLCFHLSGRQRPIAGMRETYITVARARRLAATAGLELAAALAGSSAAVPSLLFLRVGPRAGPTGKLQITASVRRRRAPPRWRRR